ncbi:hypothetical protein QBC36DRAFT_332131 [Triangularia setosa]|uniref:Glutathione S-transferase n=1 Tax=Triangularia setosa TaxID=2587417 RepID=A0AAN7A7F1_9PEZI|nr:hypothetical protein QBC36DRAFT_332131 [Podospora setosa]
MIRASYSSEASASFMPAVARAFWLSRQQKGEGVVAGAAAQEEQQQQNLLKKMAEARVEEGLRTLDERLKENNWLAGSEFTAADVMVVFPLTTFWYFYPELEMGRCEPGTGLLLGRDGQRRASWRV